MNDATPVLTSQGHLACDLCPARYDHTIVLDHDQWTPRQQLRRAASRVGWKQTSAGLEVCPADAAGPAAILVPGWTVFWSPKNAVVPLQPDPEATLVFPAVDMHGTA